MDNSQNSGLSPVIGIIMLVAITIALTAIIGFFATEMAQNQGTTGVAEVEAEGNSDGSVSVRLQQKGPNVDRINIVVGGTVSTTLSEVGESENISVEDDETISYIGVTEDGSQTVIENNVEDSINISTPTNVSYSSSPDCSTVSYNGSGTESNRYEISNVHQLQCMNQDLDAHYKLVNDIDASKTSEWNDGSGFKPVGTDTDPYNAGGEQPFTGSLEGQDYEITGLTVIRTTGDLQGLFGYSSGDIYNVGLKNPIVTGRNYVGPLVAYNTDGKIENSYTKSGEVNTTYGYVGHVGGLVGHNNGNISNSYSTTYVTGRSKFRSGVGGLVGYGGSSSKIVSSYATGEVDFGGGTTWMTQKVGGFIGTNKGTISDSYATGTVSASGRTTGGFVGRNEGGTINTSYAKGNVKNTNKGVVGGFAGKSDGTLLKVYSTGDVESSDQQAGGLVGYNQGGGVVKKSYSTGSVTAYELQAGGLAGINNGRIQNSYSTGDVTGTHIVGSAVGWNRSGTITKTYSVGSVTGDDSCEYYCGTTGGFVGENGENDSATINYSYWNIDTAGTEVYGKRSGGSASNNKGLTTEEMQGSSASGNMSQLDFTDIWTTRASDEYPELQWESE